MIYAGANAVSDDGSVLAGFGTTDTGLKALRWTSAGGLVDIGDLADGGTEIWADAITADGSSIVGHETSAAGKEAVVWQTLPNPERVADVLSAHGVSVSSGAGSSRTRPASRSSAR